MKKTKVIQGTLKAKVLELLQQKGRMYGYEITQALKVQQKGKGLAAEGALYPVLHGLVAEGLLTVEKENLGNRVRKFYTITEQGQGTVAETLSKLEAAWYAFKNLLDPIPSFTFSA